jgi:hypothetical protein
VRTFMYLPAKTFQGILKNDVFLSTFCILEVSAEIFCWYVSQLKVEGNLEVLRAGFHVTLIQNVPKNPQK